MNLLASRPNRAADQPSPPSAPVGLQKWRTWRVAIITGIALVAAFGAWIAFAGGSESSSSSSAPAAAAHTQKLAGTFTIFGGGTATDACAGVDASGEVVTVTNAAGTVLTKGTLSPGAPVATGHGCAYRFAAPRPASANAYLVAVGDRGRLSFTHAQMAAAHWKVDINIGSQQPTG